MTLMPTKYIRWKRQSTSPKWHLIHEPICYFLVRDLLINKKKTGPSQNKYQYVKKVRSYNFDGGRFRVSNWKLHRLPSNCRLECQRSNSNLINEMLFVANGIIGKIILKGVIRVSSNHDCRWVPIYGFCFKCSLRWLKTIWIRFELTPNLNRLNRFWLTHLHFRLAMITK